MLKINKNNLNKKNDLNDLNNLLLASASFFLSFCLIKAEPEKHLE
jgi:hypothetical protein